MSSSLRTRPDSGLTLGATTGSIKKQSFSPMRQAVMPQNDSFERLNVQPNKPVSAQPLMFAALGHAGQTVAGYQVTNRGYDELEDEVYPWEWLSELKPGMTVLDVGAGKGQFVKDLQERGISAEGMDQVEHSTHVAKVDITATDENTYKNKYDRITSSWSIFSYPSESPAFQKMSLQKMASWLKPTGKIILSPVNYLVDECKLQDILPGNLKVTDRQLCKGKFLGRPIKCIELTKQD